MAGILSAIAGNGVSRYMGRRNRHRRRLTAANESLSTHLTDAWKKLSVSNRVARLVALGGTLIEVENPGDHPIPPSYEYELFSNPHPLVAAGRPA